MVLCAADFSLVISVHVPESPFKYRLVCDLVPSPSLKILLIFSSHHVGPRSQKMLFREGELPIC